MIVALRFGQEYVRTGSTVVALQFPGIIEKPGGLRKLGIRKTT